MQQHLSVRNASHAAVDWAASPVGQLVRVEVLVTLSCALLTMLVFLGSGRRTSRSAAFRAVVWSALMLSYPAVSYTIGLMQSASFRNELMVVWACFLLGCADGIAACSVDDSDQQARLLLNQAAQTIYVLLLLLSYVASLRLELKILLFLFWVLTVAKLGLRLQRLVSVGRDRVLTVENGLITKYMRDEDWLCRVEQVDDVRLFSSMEDHYLYVVTGEENLRDEFGEYKVAVKNDIVTLNRVYSFVQGGIESAREFRQHPPVGLCLSFALFKLLRRRLTGSPHYELHESIVHKVRTLFYHQLMLEANTGDNMYGVIEVELGFLFDFFYARYPSHKQSLIPETAVFTTAVALGMSSLFWSTMRHYGANVSVITTRYDIWLTRLVIFLFIILEAFQYLSLVLSDWHIVKLFCRHLVEVADNGRSRRWDRLVRALVTHLLVLMRRFRTRQYWSNTVGQYSLLHACIQYESSCIFRMWLPKWIRSFLIRASMTTHRNLPPSVRCAIAQELGNSLYRVISSSDYSYSQTTRSVRYYDPQHDFRAPRTGFILPKPTIRNILTWHIATTMCEDDLKIPSSEPAVTIASTLSAYCAYLVCHAPELITDNIYETQLLLEGVQRRARRRLKGCRSKEDMCRNLSAFKPDKHDEYEVVLAQGARLRKLLSDRFADKERWELLAQVWVKFLLSRVAPSNNVAAHVKRLATGGEFITHLWAFMTQGGFVRQPWISCGDKSAEEDPVDLEQIRDAGRTWTDIDDMFG